MSLRIKNSVSELIGKTVSGIAVAEYADGNPTKRIFLTFSDGDALEIWQDDDTITIARDSNTDGMDQLIKMMKQREGAKIQAFRPPHEDPKDPQRDLLTKSR